MITTAGKDELEFLDVSTRRIHTAASELGIRCECGRETETMKYGNERDIGLDTAKTVSYTLRLGTQMVALLRNFVTNLVEASSVQEATYCNRGRWRERRLTLTLARPRA